MKWYYTNAHSLLNKRNEFEAQIDDVKADVVGITESWTHEDVNDSEILLSGFNVFRQDRKDTQKGRGGGVLLYIKEGFQATQVMEYEEYGFTNSVWCDLLT